MNILKVFDNKGKTDNRYMVVLDKEGSKEGIKYNVAISLSEDPDRGLSLWVTFREDMSEDLGDEINFDDLPYDVKNHVKDKIKKF